MTSLKAVLWDMDGTLIDSEPFWRQEEQRLMHRAGLSWDEEDANTYVGQATAVTAEGMRRRGLDVPLYELVDAIIVAVAARVNRQLPWIPGARELLDAVPPLKGALVTMSHRAIAQPLIDAVPDAFQAVVTGDMVTRSKPDPEPYATAAAMLGVDPSECIALEDSIPGVAAATGAGVVTVGVGLLIPLAGSDAHEVVPSLEMLGREDLSRIHARHASVSFKTTPFQ